MLRTDRSMPWGLTVCLWLSVASAPTCTASDLDGLILELVNSLTRSGTRTAKKAVAEPQPRHRPDAYTLGQVMDGWDNTIVAGCSESVVEYLRAKVDRLHRDPIRITTLKPDALRSHEALLNDRCRFTIFLVDRSHSEFPEEWAHLFRSVGDPTTLKPYEVMAAALDKRAKRCFNIVVSAPDERRLTAYLDWLTVQPVGYGKTPPVHECHKLVSVEPVRVVTNLDHAVARRLMQQLGADNDYDIDYLTPSQAASDPGDLDGATEVYLLARDNGTLPRSIASRLPIDLAELEGAEQVAVRHLKPGGLQTAVLAYRTERHLRDAVEERFATLLDVPETAHVSSLVDLADYRRLAVAPVVDRTSRARDGATVARRLTNEIVTQLRHEVGFEVENQADLKSLLADTALAMQGYVKRHVVDAAREMTAADALFVGDLTVLNQRTDYRSDLSRSTPVPSDLLAENEPDKPSPSARRYGLFGPKVYRLGSEDPAYLEDYRTWDDEHRDWKRRRGSVELGWVEKVVGDSVVSCEVQCRLIGLREGPDYGKVLWSETVNVREVNSWDADVNRYTVRGVDRTPVVRSRAAGTSVPTAVRHRCTSAAAEQLRERLYLRCLTQDPRRQPSTSAWRDELDVPAEGALVAAVDDGAVWLLLGERCRADMGDRFDVRVGTKAVKAPNGTVIHREPLVVAVIVQEAWPADEAFPARARCAPEAADGLAKIEPRQTATPVEAI